jgi:antitoxin (DNA-binding transcriptional repressor) of toxin-antitoxin stability system
MKSKTRAEPAFLMVNTHEAKSKLSQLLRIVEEKKRRIRICRNGKAIAELGPVARVPDPLQQHPKLKAVRFHEDARRPVDPSDWPEELR